ncbi:MAG: flagellar M-ring protein FliF [Nitriliruptoraceae bacterium]|nr:flagellar M-ring protein FliF [Nitriliruptoraceae bacterium]
MDVKDRLAGLIRALPPAQRAGLAVAALVLIMAAVPFVRWVTTPSYSVLFAGLEDRELGEVTDELDALGIPYELDGTRVLVPQDRLHRTRADLAQSGVSATPSVSGYELLDDQALGISDFRQRVDLQRAVEGELARTLSSMDTIESATVRLVLPEDPLFTDNRTPATASVLVRPARQMDRNSIEAVALLVASAVEGLETDQVTVADTSGMVLHSPGDGSTSGVTDRQQRMTRDFEQALAADLTQLLQRATDKPASAVVRATLDFNESETQTETFEEGGIPLRESTNVERYEGTAPIAGGIAGVDGGPLNAGQNEGNYEREDAVREFGVDRTTTRTVQAPGAVTGLSVALVVDDGAPIGDAELQQLVAAAAGINAERGDEIAISRVPTPPVAELEAVEEGPELMDLIATGVALLVLLVIAVALFLMSRRKGKDIDTGTQKVVPATVKQPEALPEQPKAEELPVGPSMKDEVAELVERQPEEIAALLRSWLADRRGAGV